MSGPGYQLRFDRSLPDEAARVFRGQVGAARRALKHPDDRSVHAARKALKRARALLRLVRAPLPADRLAALDGAVRLAGRRLGPVRDAAVARETLDRLRDRLDAETAGALQEAFERRHEAAWARLEATGGAESVRAELALIRLLPADLVRLDPEALEPALARTYGGGRDRFRAVRYHPDSEALHAWRRRVKTLGYHLRLLTAAWPLVLRPTARAFDDLGALLGDDHDLAELAALAGTAGLSGTALDRFRAQVRLERTAFHPHLWRLGTRLYAEPRDDFGRRIARYAAAAHHEQAPAPAPAAVPA